MPAKQDSQPHPLLHLNALTWTQVDALPRAQTLVLCCVGPLFGRGPHLPLGAGLLVAEALAELVAEQWMMAYPDWKVVAAPPLGLGHVPSEASFPGTISLRPETAHSLALDLLSGLAGHGLTQIALIAPALGRPMCLALQAAADEVTVQHKSTIHVATLCDALDDGRFAEAANRSIAAHNAARRSPLLPLLPRQVEAGLLDFQGGVLETSVLLHLRPDLVQGYEVERLGPVRVDIRKARERGDDLRSAGNGLGYFGDPRLASAALGEIWLQAACECLGHTLQDVFAPARPLPADLPGLSSLPANGHSDDVSDPLQASLRQGIALVQAGRIEENPSKMAQAAAHFAQLVAEHPACAECWYWQARALCDQATLLTVLPGADKRAAARLIEQALPLVESCLRLSPGLADAYRVMATLLAHKMALGGTFEAMRFGTRATQALQKSLSLDPKNALATLQLGIQKVSNPASMGGDLNAGLGLLERALELDPTLWEAHVWKGRALLNKGQRQAARLEFERAMAQNPRSVWARTERGKT